jgi:phenylacetate-CoA ligase
MPLWDPHYETMKREDLVQLQLERLQATLNRAYRNVPYYRALFDKHRIVPEETNSFEDLARIPFTTKQTLRDAYPYGMFAVPLREIVRIHSSSGTTGKPTVVGYTRNDLRHWSEVVARMFSACGVTSDDVVQIAFDYGLATGGFGFHYGAELIGASVIPTSLASPEKQVHIMRDYKSSVLVSTPSLALAIAERLKALGIDRNQLSLRRGLFGGEPWSERVRRQLEDALGISALDNYGLSEIIGPGVAGECLEKDGLHIFEDHFIPEIINPETQEVAPLGGTGELVLTTISKEACPLIRFRTGDITRLIGEPCGCGRTFLRIARISGRTDDMIIIRGINIFPAQIEEILLACEGTEPHYQIIIERSEGGIDTLELLVEVSAETFYDEMKRLIGLEERIRERMMQEFDIPVRVKLVEPKTLQRSLTKSSRIIDKRNL